MKVLVACEFSGVVRDAFAARGHEAWSCDLLPSETVGNHYQADVLSVLDRGWDLVIAHPPCTYLCSSGMHWTTRGLRDPRLTEEALNLVRALMNADAPMIAVENPVGCISTRIRPADQIIQPWQFGHPESKATCLWIKGLPRLRPTMILALPESGYWSNQTPSGQNRLGPSSRRWAQRSRTYPGIASAMADQWGNLACPVLEYHQSNLDFYPRARAETARPVRPGQGHSGALPSSSPAETRLREERGELAQQHNDAPTVREPSGTLRREPPPAS